MADECAGEWASSLTYLIKDRTLLPEPYPVNDGVIEIYPHQGDEFEGRHRDTGEPLTDTECVLVNEVRRIGFTRRISASEVIVYSGEVIDGRIIIGRFVHRGGPADGDTGTWGATNPVGPLDDNLKAKTENRSGRDA